MKLLLDTHVWLWSLLTPDRLTTAVREALVSPSNEIWYSPITTWETLLLIERGKLSPHVASSEWLDRMVRAMPRREAPITHEVALQSRQLAMTNQDPGDRFLAATALVHGLTLVTADAELLRCPGLAVMPNR